VASFHWHDRVQAVEVDPNRALDGQGLVQIPKGEARSASFSEDYVAAPRHMNP
jgi:hypothetical protein